MRVTRWGIGLLAVGFGLLSGGEVAAQAGPEVCLLGFSKVMRGEFKGDWAEASCASLGSFCRTGASSSNELNLTVRSNSQKCAPGATCEETRELTGHIRARIELKQRKQNPCPYRGAYEGKLEFIDTTGLVVAVGEIRSTLGVGTHQKACLGPSCPTAPARCETCYDVQFPGNQWNMGTEGFIDAKVFDGRYKGCRIRASHQGTFVALGGVSGPVPPGIQPWSLSGNIDGVLECPCGL
jgi:hypothetical protein